MKEAILHRGTLTEGRFKELEAKHGTYSPHANPDAISIIKQPDGNYKGWMQKAGRVVEARQADPGTVLTLLLTHSGGESA